MRGSVRGLHHYPSVGTMTDASVWAEQFSGLAHESAGIRNPAGGGERRA